MLRVVRFLMLVVALAACGGAGQHAARPRPTEGAITGLTRDRDTMDPLGTTEVHAERAGDADRKAFSGRDGIYTFDHIPPGRYTVIGTYGGGKVTIKNVVVDVGEATYVDLPFVTGQPVVMEWLDPRLTEITHFHPKDRASAIVGEVTDGTTHARIAGAVVTALGGGTTLQAVSGDDGRYRFDHVTPGVYVVSAYYSVSGHGQIEVRRADIHIDDGEGVDVPLLIETTKAN